MKKSVFFAALFLVLVVSLTALPFFNKKGEKSESGKGSSGSGQVSATNKTEKKSSGSGKSSVDFDLTKMNANMVYAEVFNMMVEPERYENKTIRMRGSFEIYYDNPSGLPIYAVIISDATACCQQGMEFRWDFQEGSQPPVGSDITVTGKYCTDFLEEDLLYSFIKADEVSCN